MKFFKRSVEGVVVAVCAADNITSAGSLFGTLSEVKEISEAEAVDEQNNRLARDTVLARATVDASVPRSQEMKFFKCPAEGKPTAICRAADVNIAKTEIGEDIKEINKTELMEILMFNSLEKWLQHWWNAQR